jgi:mono/diheme cytochrome c family protein
MAMRVVASTLLSALPFLVPAPASAGSGDADIGRQLSEIYCTGCHRVDSTDAQAPALGELDSSLAAAVSEDTILEELSSHHEHLPPFDLTPNQAANIVAYIGSIKAAGLGRLLIEENCSPCHATGLSGESPHPDAPAFRTLSRNYPVSQLAEALAEGIMTGHPDMPEFIAEPGQIDDMIAYLESIQEE